MAFKQEVNVPMLFTTAIMGGIVLVVLVLGTQASSRAKAAALKAAATFRTARAALQDVQVDPYARCA